MKKYSNNTFWIKLINSKFFLILMFFLLLYVGYAIYGELNSQKDIKNNIQTLEAEQKKLEDNNLDLTALLKYYKSDEYIEKEAREKLNMARVGEHVVIVPDNEAASKKDQSSDKFKNKKNWELWVEYFFGGNRRM